jgi:hypothetical protein
MIAKTILAASLCFAFFIMPRFWQHDLEYIRCTAALSAQTDSIFKENNQKVVDDIDRVVRANPKGVHWKVKKAYCDRNLDTLLTFLNKKTAQLETQKSLSVLEIDSVVVAEKHFNQRIMNLLDPREQKNFSTKFMTCSILGINSHLNTSLQKRWLQNLKMQAFGDAIILGHYCLDKWSGRGYSNSKYKAEFCTKNFAKYERSGEIVLAENEQTEHNDSVWVNGILSTHYEFVPHKTGYHYFCVKAKVTTEKGNETILRDTFKVHITK